MCKECSISVCNKKKSVIGAGTLCLPQIGGKMSYYSLTLFLDSVEDLMNLLKIHLDSSDKDYGDFLSSMADCYRENVNNGMAMGEPETFETSFWNAFSLIECCVDVAENSYVVEDMFRYGYTWNGMIPMNSSAARELFGKFTIYALYADGSEAEVTDKDDVEDGGMYGVHLEDWNRPFK